MHNHDDNCGCGHDHDHELMITLTLDDDTELDCLVLSIFPVEDKHYIALLPTDSVDEDTSEIYLYQYVEHDSDEVELLNIVSDDEFKKVSEAFDELSDEDDDYFDYDFFEDDDFDDDDDDFDDDYDDDDDDDNLLFFDDDEDN